PPSLRLEQQVSQRQEAEVTRNDLAKSARRARSRARIRISRRSRRNGIRNLCRRAATASRRRRHGSASHKPGLGLWQRRRHAVQAVLAWLGLTEEAGLHPQRQRERGRPDASHGGVLKDSDSVWKVIAWITSVNPS